MKLGAFITKGREGFFIIVVGKLEMAEEVL
jgi:hypothetical protein